MMRTQKPFYALGVGLCMVSFLMLAMIPISISFDEWGTIAGFFSGGLMGGFIGGGVLLINRRRSEGHARLGELLCLLLLWIGLPFFAAFPFYAAGQAESFAAAFFESVSGLTTTGASIISRAEEAPSILILWRSILHGVGGGLTLFSIIFILAPNGLSFIRPSSSAGGSDLAIYCFGAIILVYMGGMGLSFALLTLFGIPVFDSLCIALSAVSTGGFMPHSGGLGIYESQAGEMIVAASMLFGALNFFVYANFIHGLFLRGGYGMSRFYSRDIHVFLFFVFLLSVLLTLSFSFSERGSMVHYMWHGFFYAISIITTSGIGEGHGLSMMFLVPICVFLMIGGSACSTAGGIKTHHFMALIRQGEDELKRLILPHGVRPSAMSDRDIFVSWAVFLLFLLGVVFFSGLFGVIGVNFSSSILGAVSILSNGGAVPGLFSDISPILANGYGAFPDWLLVLLCFGMILGRVEFLCIVAIITIMRHKMRWG